MKKVTLQFALLLAIACTTLLSCQGEENNVSQPNPENLTKDSELTGLLRRMTSTDSISDNLVDSTSCFRLKQPYQVLVHDGGTAVALEYTFTVTDAASQQQLNSIITGFGDADDHIGLYYPVTVQFADGTETVVNNASELNIAKMQCDTGTGTSTDPITCANINYPITIYSYNVDFQVAETYTIQSDAELVAMLAGITPGQFFAIDFPISLTLSNGNILTANSNAELISIMQQAITLCDTPIGNPCNNPHILTDDLVLYIPFGNGATKDLTGFANAGLLGSYHYVTDRSGNAQGALSFDGGTQDGYLVVPGNLNNDMNMDGKWTVSLWFNRQDLVPTQFEELFNLSQMSIMLGNQSQAEIKSPFLVVPGLSDPLYDINWINNGMLEELNVWHHLAITWNGQMLNFYRDGVLVNSTNNTSFSGVMGGGIFGPNYKGYMDDIRCYKRDLSQQEVQTLYNLPGDVNTCLN